MSVLIPKCVEVTESVIFQKLHDEAVLLDLTTQVYYGLDGVGSTMWNLLTENGDLENVLSRLKTIYNAEENRLRTDLQRLVGELIELNLLRSMG